jgi:hypothetical protein
MPQNPNQRRASDAVAAWLAANYKNNAWLAEAAKADAGTIGDFLNGQRWPKVGTQGRIEDALGWPSGTIRQIGNGAEVPESLTRGVGADTQDDGFVAAPGPHQSGGISDDEVLRVLDNMQRELDVLRQRVEGRRKGS